MVSMPASNPKPSSPITCSDSSSSVEAVATTFFVVRTSSLDAISSMNLRGAVPPPPAAGAAGATEGPAGRGEPAVCGRTSILEVLDMSARSVTLTKSSPKSGSRWKIQTGKPSPSSACTACSSSRIVVAAQLSFWLCATVALAKTSSRNVDILGSSYCGLSEARRRRSGHPLWRSPSTDGVRSPPMWCAEPGPRGPLGSTGTRFCRSNSSLRSATVIIQ